MVTVRQTPRSIGTVKITSANELNSENWGMCIALYGPPGVGKTTRAAEIAYSPYGSPAVILDAEGGTRVVTHIPNLDIAPIANWQELNSVSREIVNSKDKSPWKSVIIDNMSEIMSMHMRSITQGTPQIQEYMRNTSEMLNFTRQWRDFARFSGINVIFIAWSAPELDETTGARIYKQDVAFTPSLARQFPGIIDIIGYMTVDGNTGVRTITFAPSTRTAAKFRRANNDVASKIPLVIKFNERMRPIEDIVGTLKGGLPWPSEKYNLKEERQNTT